METSILETTVEAEKACENLLTPAQRSIVQRNRRSKLAHLLLLDIEEAGIDSLELTQGQYKLTVSHTRRTPRG